MSKKFPDVNINIQNIQEVHNSILATYVKKLAIKYLEVEEGRVLARLDNLKEYKFLTGAISGQVLMSAIDTVMSMAMSTSSKSQRDHRVGGFCPLRDCRILAHGMAARIGVSKNSC